MVVVFSSNFYDIFVDVSSIFIVLFSTIGLSFFSSEIHFNLFLLSFLFSTFLISIHHRYFAHASFKTTFSIDLLIFIITSAYVPIANLLMFVYWPIRHKSHHAHSDTSKDLHSPYHTSSLSVIFSLPWLLKCIYTTPNFISPSGTNFKHLSWLNVPIHFAIQWFCIANGYFSYWFYGLASPFICASIAMGLTNWCSHVIGSRPFQQYCDDFSTNQWVTFLINFGENFHNNHHAFPRSARHGLAIWEVDVTWYILSALSEIGLVWDLYVVSDEAQKTRWTEQRVSMKKQYDIICQR